MKRPLAVFAVLTVLAMLAGCKSATSFTDPFVGRTTVTPPGTGQIAGQNATTPYYTPPNSGGTAQPGATVPSWITGSQGGQPPATGTTNPRTFGTPGTAPGTLPNSGLPSTAQPGTNPSSRYSPPQGFQYNGNSTYKGSNTGGSQPSGSGWSRPGERPSTLNRLGSGTTLAASRTANSGDRSTIATSPAAATSSTVATVGSSGGQSTASSSLAGRERIVRTIGPPPAGSTARPAAVRPWPYPASSSTRSSGRSTTPAAPTKAIDIMDLPPSRTSASATSSNGVRLASTSSTARASKPASKAVPATTDSFTSSAKYGHDPDYRWLKGKLEYSQIDRSWKLRYIPVEGKGDNYGGSVVLDEKSLGSGLERGHFVEVHGRVAAGTKPEGSYAPVYEVAELKRLGK